MADTTTGLPAAAAEEKEEKTPPPTRSPKKKPKPTMVTTATQTDEEEEEEAAESVPETLTRSFYNSISAGLAKASAKAKSDDSSKSSTLSAWLSTKLPTGGGTAGAADKKGAAAEPSSSSEGGGGDAGGGGGAQQPPDEEKEEDSSSSDSSSSDAPTKSPSQQMQLGAQKARSMVSSAMLLSQSVGAALKERSEEARRKKFRFEGEASSSFFYAADAEPSEKAIAQLNALHELARLGVGADAYEPKLRALWLGAFALRDEGAPPPFERRGDQWPRLGFSSANPDDTVRGGGLLALDAAVFFLDKYPKIAAGLLAGGGRPSEEEPSSDDSSSDDRPPFAEAAVAVSRELARFVDIGSPLGVYPRKRSFWGAMEHPDSFFELFSVAMAVVAREWAASKNYAQLGLQNNRRRAAARLNAAIRAATRECETLLAQGPHSKHELLLLARSVPGSPQHDKINALCSVAHRTDASDFFRDDASSSGTDDDDDHRGRGRRRRSGTAPAKLPPEATGNNGGPVASSSTSEKNGAHTPRSSHGGASYGGDVTSSSSEDGGDDEKDHAPPLSPLTRV